MNIQLLSAAILAATSTCVGAAAAFDPEKAPVGEVKFQLVQDEIVKGQMVYKTRFEGGDYIIDEATAMRPDIKETGTFVLDGDTFQPKRIIIDADFSSHIVDADIRVENGALRGEYRTRAPGAIEKTVTPVEFDLPAGVVARASMFGLVAALPLKTGGAYPITWFNTLNGRIEAIEVTVEGVETISVPAGAYEAIVARFKDANPENVVYVARQSRDVVRIDVPSMNMRFERLPAETSEP